jgi:LacI family transcriptional regulator
VTDDFDSGYNATSHLLHQGCTNIAFISGPSSLSISTNRLNGYKKALAEHGYDNPRILYCGGDNAEDYHDIRELLQPPGRPDGLIACVEKFTTATYLACKDLGLNIPADLKLISFTNLHTARILNPSLTTITQPAFEMGRTAATVLFEGLCKKRPDLRSETIVIPSVLHERESST